MKYLGKFSNFLNESNSNIADLSKEELEEMLLPIADLGIEYSVSDPKTITEGEFSGFTSVNISFGNNFEVISTGVYSDRITDNRFWEFLDELISFKNRLESDQVSINTNWKNYIVITFIQKSKVEGNLFKVEKLYNEIGKRMNASKSDFSNGMVKRLNKDELKIVVTCGDSISPYTDRKWNGFVRGIDFSDFNVDKNVTTDRWDNLSAVITITIKK